MHAQSKLLSVVVICGMVAIGAGAAFRLRHSAASAQLQTGTILVPPRGFADFNLIDNRGRHFGAAELRGHWSLLFFGYTNCPDFCPTTLSLLAAMEKRLREVKAPVVPQVIFMSVDAKRDTPTQLAQYVPYFDPSFIGVTAADQPAIEKVAKELGVAVIIQPAADGSYTVDHSGSIYVLDTEGKIAAILTGPFTVDSMTQDFKRIVDARA